MRLIPMLVGLALAPWAALAGAAEVRVGPALKVDLPWVTGKDSTVRSGPHVPRADSFLASFWSSEEGRVMAILAVEPWANSYFVGTDRPLDEQIATWGFFEDKTIADRRPLGCANGACLGFTADDVGCAVFTRQIGTPGRSHIDSHTEAAGPRVYGFYCRVGASELDAGELDAVLQGIRG